MLQFASDLHLDFHSVAAFPLRPVARTLLLAGDIGNPTSATYLHFLKYCSENWENVFFVAGNHEFYNKKPATSWRFQPPRTHSETIRLLEQLAGKFPNVHFLNRTRVDCAGLTFLGATLWTDLSADSDASNASVGVNDYKYIAETDSDGVRRPIVTQQTTRWHREDRAWLETEIAQATTDKRTVVVLTHHLPTQALIHAKYAGHPLNAAFATPMDELVGAVRIWIAGHSHTAMRVRMNKAYAVLNPRGYPREDSGFSPEATIDYDVPGEIIDELDVIAVNHAVQPCKLAKTAGLDDLADTCEFDDYD
jgi:hypothetical protein